MKNSMSQSMFAEEIGTCLGNISKIEQGLSRLRFCKYEYTYQGILQTSDGMVATIMALDRHLRNEGEPQGSVYDERGLLVF